MNRLILVDENDNILGYDTRENCHQGRGLLHRAFSIFIFNPGGKLLIQERSAAKLLWPLFWSNSVCSHPREGEAGEEAAHRRLKEEINIDAPLRFLFKFQYQASYKEIGSENELCSVYIGMSGETISADPAEIAAWRYVEPDRLDEEIAANPGRFSPWFKIEWQRIRKDHMKEVEELFLHAPGGSEPF